MKVRRSVLLGVILLALPTAALAYKESTHEAMAEAALARSSLMTDPQALEALGLRPINAALPAYQQDFFPTSKGEDRFILGLFRFGARYEDNVFFDFRFLRHFFDPLRDQGLGGYPASPDWGLEDNGSETGQEFSYRDAKEYFRTAVTTSDRPEYERSWGRAFQSLGQIIHLIQDMAQPEHTRNDPHPPRDDLYEVYTAGRGGQLTSLFDQPYPSVSFGKPRHFWTAPGLKGIAEFTNANFVSKDTNFRTLNGQVVVDAEYPNPQPISGPNPIALVDLLPDRGPGLCAGLKSGFILAPPNTTCDIDFYSTLVFDRYSDPGGGAAVVNDRASSSSVFNQYLSFYNTDVPLWAWGMVGGGTRIHVDRIFTLNRFNFDRAHTFLLHRAVAYSAGLVDHFFRGRIEITPPDEGVYGVVDHSAIARREFTKIKLKARNTTAASTVHERIIAGGTLRAVAHYTLNPCYQDNLSGEINILNVIWSGCPMAVYLSGEKGISVSKLTSIAHLSDTEEVPFTFDFSADPIPLNVRDLTLSVVFTGALGSELDGIAVGTVNLSEPTFVSQLNSMDYFSLNGDLYTPAQIRSDGNLRSQLDFDGDGDVDQNDIDIDPEPMIDARLQIGEHVLAGPTPLHPKNYFRIAVLADSVDRQPLGFPLLFTHLTEDPRFPGGIPSSSFTTVRQLQNQFERDPTRASAIGKVRGVHYWYMRFIIKRHGDENATLDDFVALPDLPDPGPTPITINFE